MLSLTLRTVSRRGVRSFFKDGFKDNASLELVYRSVIRSPAVAEKLLDFYAANVDELSVESLSGLKADGASVAVPLQPYLGDPHRVLLAYSLLPDTIETEADGNPIVKTQIGDEPQKIKIVDAEVITFLAKATLTKLGHEATPEAARAYLDSMVDGTEELYAKLPAVAPSPIEQAIAEINAETAPLESLKNLAPQAELHKLKWAHVPHPISGKVEGKFRYFI